MECNKSLVKLKREGKARYIMSTWANKKDELFMSLRSMHIPSLGMEKERYTVLFASSCLLRHYCKRQELARWIPMAVKELFDQEAQIPKNNDTATVENIIHTAALLFAVYVDAATSMSESCGGGGSAPSLGWGKDKDEDDLKFARRCLQQSHAMCKPRIKFGRGR